ncbi:MAG TPA: GntR family transcriptional regulator [Phycisphaeraceae bacterium]
MTRKQRAYEYLREMLACGKLKPGMRISDVALTKKLGLSRTPIREAFLQLESEGFLEQIPRQGTFVKTYDRHELQCIFELRQALEAYAAGRAAEHMDDREIGQLEQLCDELHHIVRAARQADGSPAKELVERSAVVDVAFHFLILHASANPFLNQIISNYRLMTRVWTAQRNDPFHAPLKVWAVTWRDHYRILRAIKKRDSEQAQRWMSYHIARANKEALAYYDLVRRKSLATHRTEWAKPVLDTIKQLEQMGSVGHVDL